MIPMRVNLLLKIIYLIFQKGETKMPKVGKKNFAYTAKGKAAAKKFAKKSGKKVQKKKGY